ncbi:hypothetical protein CDD83_11181 [Cordyceps sp. RAO-2017]|nr:hypothetical protein CDD83_11181 [Cordyceps sp. RAO-2017]
MTVTASEAKAPFLGLTGGRLVFWITVACATDMALFGYDQGVFSGVVVTDDFLHLHGLVGPSKTTLIGTVSSIYAVGCFLGAIVAFTVGERLGRRKAVMLGTAVMAVGALLQAASYGLPQMVAGRIISGLGNGINTATAPVWQTETAPAKWRGKLVLAGIWLNIAGFSLVNWINYGLSFAGGSVAWRFPLAFQLLFIFVLGATTPWLPESPRWLLARGRKREALLVLGCLEARPEQDPALLALAREIEYGIRYEREHAASWRRLVLGRGKAAAGTKPLRRLLLGAGTQFMHQMGGVNIMSYYLPTVFIASVGLSNSAARLLVACNSISYLVFSFLAVALVERWGRRGLMMASTLGQCLCFLVITILLRLGAQHPEATGLPKSAIPFFFLYYMVFGIGMGGVPWLYPTEINSLPMRTKGAAVATCTNWITNFAVVEITPLGIQTLGWRFWIVWTVTNAVFLPIIYFVYPETANRSLEDVDEYYRSDPPIVVTGDAEAVSVKRPGRFVDRERAEIAQSQRRDAMSVTELGCPKE